MVSYFSKTSTSTEVQSGPLTTTTAGTSTTTTTQVNTGGNMNYVIYHNTNSGNREPLTKTTTTTSAEVKVEFKTPVVSISKKGSIDTKGVTTDENSVKANLKIKGVSGNVTASVATTSDGQTKVTGQVMVGSAAAQGGGSVQVSTNGRSTSVQVGIGGQTKAGTTTVTTQSGIKFKF